MRRDLEVAPATWIDESQSDDERTNREASDFLTYQDSEGLIADFHAHRHTFISNLGRAGVTLGTAQKLARHSDPRLTSNIYTHLELADEAAAISTLPTPPTNSVPIAAPLAEVDYNSGDLFAVMYAGACDFDRRQMAEVGNIPSVVDAQTPKPGADPGFGIVCHDLAVGDKVRPRGFEPLTLGSEDRCAIQLRHGRLPCLDVS